MGLTHSTVRIVVSPRRSPRGSQAYWGELRKTGSITSAASRIRSIEIEVFIERDDRPLKFAGASLIPDLSAPTQLRPPRRRSASSAHHERGGPIRKWGGARSALGRKLVRRPGGSQGGALRLKEPGGTPACSSTRRTLRLVKGY